MWASDLLRSTEVITVRGVVCQGDQRGREIGFPTANLPLREFRHPDGVWAGWLSAPGQGTLAAAVSVGTRSTFYGRDGMRLLEAHVLDFDGDLYDTLVTVDLACKIRGQRRFASLDALVTQLHDDVEVTRRWCQSRASAVERDGRSTDCRDVFRDVSKAKV